MTRLDGRVTFYPANSFDVGIPTEVFMYGRSVNKQRSARSFRGRAAKTHKRNVHGAIRGGIRL